MRILLFNDKWFRDLVMSREAQELTKEEMRLDLPSNPFKFVVFFSFVEEQLVLHSVTSIEIEPVDAKNTCPIMWRALKYKHSYLVWVHHLMGLFCFNPTDSNMRWPFGWGPRVAQLVTDTKDFKQLNSWIRIPGLTYFFTTTVFALEISWLF